MKYLMTFAVMLLLALALAARQGTNSAKPDDSEKSQPAIGQPSPSMAADKTTNSDKANNDDQKPQAQLKSNNHGKLPLNLGSMPCAPDDKECRTREKEMFPPQAEHP